MTAPSDDMIRAVNQALDAARHSYGVETDAELARIYDVSPKQISFWRNGRWTIGDRALITTLLRCEQPVVESP